MKLYELVILNKLLEIHVIALEKKKDFEENN
jgi:hypothetical protein